MTAYSAVVTTGIYCRPGCAGRPLAQHVRAFDHPAAAEAAGFRACHRCRPYRVAVPVTGSAPELVCAAVQQIIGGVLDDGGTEAVLAARIGISARHLRRLFAAHLGVSPDQLARSRRAHFARTSCLPTPDKARAGEAWPGAGCSARPHLVRVASG
jgi:AraC family transcriptional regulator, regulatory protein of adaptative response / DNA-3-methyladenine glycosylase II